MLDSFCRWRLVKVGRKGAFAGKDHCGFGFCISLLFLGLLQVLFCGVIGLFSICGGISATWNKIISERSQNFVWCQRFVRFGSLLCNCTPHLPSVSRGLSRANLIGPTHSGPTVFRLASIRLYLSPTDQTNQGYCRLIRKFLGLIFLAPFDGMSITKRCKGRRASSNSMAMVRSSFVSAEMMKVELGRITKGAEGDLLALLY